MKLIVVRRIFYFYQEKQIAVIVNIEELRK